MRKIILLGVALLAACSGGKTTLKAILISPPDGTVAVGATEQLSATGVFSDGTTQDLTKKVAWSSSVAANATVDANGVVTGVAAGASTLTAKDAATGITGTAKVTVGTVGNVTLTKVVVAPTAPSIAVGGTVQLSATGVFSDGSTQDLTASAQWSSSDSAKATVTAGLVTGVAAGTATITATSGSLSGTAALTVSAVAAPTLTRIVVSPSTASLQVGASLQLTATGVFSDGTTQDLTSSATWTPSDASVATVSAGTVQALATGTVTLTAAKSGKSGTSSLTVIPVTTPTLSAVVVAPVSASVQVGSTVQLAATGVFTDGSTQDYTSIVTWSTGDANIASVSSSGAVLGAGAGTTSITATDPTTQLAGSASITATAAVLTGITISPASPSLRAGESVQLTATGVFSDGSVQDFTSTATWSSDDATNAPVTAGLVQARGATTATITATQGGLSGTATVTISAAALVAIGVQLPSATLPAGFTEQAVAVGVYSDGTTTVLANPTWDSSDGSVATAVGGLISAVSAGGPVNITASQDGITGSSQLTVDAATLNTLAVSPASTTIAAGSHLPYSCTGQFSDGVSLDLTSGCTFSEVGGEVTFSANVAYAVSPTDGSVTISADYQGTQGTATLTVTGAALTALRIDGPNPMTVGTTKAFTATGVFADGTTADYTSQVTWTTDDGSIAAVPNNDGMVVAYAVGATALHAHDTASGLDGVLPLQVDAVSLVSITVAPNPLNINVSDHYQLTATAYYSDGSSADVGASVTWTISGTAATNDGATVTGVSVGTSTLTATDTNSTVSGSATINVSASPVVAAVITPANANVPVGLTQQYSMMALHSDGTLTPDTNVSWQVGDTSYGNIDANGLFTSANTGSVSVTGTLTDVSGTISASTWVNINSTYAQQTYLLPQTASVQVGESITFSAWEHLDNQTSVAATNGYFWYSDTTGDVSQNGGTFTGVTPGTVTIYFYDYNNGQQPSATLTVGPPTLVSLQVNPSQIDLPKGLDRQFYAFAIYSDGSVTDVTSQATWTSGDDQTAPVSTTGLVHGAAQGGPVAITAAYSGLTASGDATIDAPAFKSLVVAPTLGAVVQGQTFQFQALQILTDNSTVDVSSSVTWTSSDPANEPISATGLVTTSASSYGTFTFTADDGNGHKPTGQLAVALDGQPLLTGVPTFSPDPAVSNSQVTVNVPVNAVTTSVCAYFMDETGTNVGGNCSSTPNADGVSFDVQFTLPCFAAGHTFTMSSANIYAQSNGNNRQTNYNINDSISKTTYYMDQYDWNTGRYDYSIPSTISRGVFTSAATQGTACTFPQMTGTPTATTAAPQGGTFAVTVPITSDVTSVNVTLYDAAGRYVGTGNATASSQTSVVVQVSMSCLISATAPLTAQVQVSNSNNMSTTYSRNTTYSSTNYTEQSYDGYYYGPSSADSIALASFGWSAQTCMASPELTASPAFSSQTVSASTSMTVTLQWAGNVNYIYLYLYNSSNSYITSYYVPVTSGSTSKTYTFTAPSNAGTYHVTGNIYGADSVFKYTSFYSNTSDTDYRFQLYDGFTYGTVADSGVPVTTFTVQ